jgi:hypothetical protein
VLAAPPGPALAFAAPALAAFATAAALDLPFAPPGPLPLGHLLLGLVLDPADRPLLLLPTGVGLPLAHGDLGYSDGIRIHRIG